MIDELFSLRPRAEHLFNALRAGSLDAVRGGVTRDTYGPGEAFAHRLMADHARLLGLEIGTDALCNTYMTWPGRNRALPAWIVGSHLDSVPGGGNFDGAAGVVSGLLAIEALQHAGVQPGRDVTVMGIRAEESLWFQYSYVGSRGALGTLKPEALERRRVDTGRSLADHLREAGGSPEAVLAGTPHLNVRSIEAFLEVHIEQAPSLAESGHAVAIGTAIPGNVRYPGVRITGEYGHVGLPRRFRRDAALAGAEIANRLDRLWETWDRAERPMAFTIGEFHTDSNRHGLTIVPGEFRFSIDLRAYDQANLRELEQAFLAIVSEVAATRQVQVDLGTRASAEVAKADPGISRDLAACASRLGIEAPPLLSPASHDSAAFCAAGVPYGFVFIRNPNGSHHPDEHMDLDDFLRATAVLAEYLREQSAFTPRTSNS
jgi:N-carbamoyl-L-amino-acid hydrolase